MTAAAEGGLGAGADLTVALSLNVGRLADEMAAARADREQRIRDIHVASIAVPQITLAAGAGTLDLPDALGPKRGRHWAIHYLTAASFTAGTVTMYQGGGVGDQNIRFIWTQAGVYEPSRTGAIVQPGARLIFVASGIVGAVTISGEVTDLDSRYLPDFLI